MDGFVFVGGQERVLDLLNNTERFLPFEHEDGRFVMINKQAIAYAWPDDGKWMGDSYASAPTNPGSFGRPAE